MIMNKKDINDFVVSTLGNDAEVTIFDASFGYGYFDAFDGVSDSHIAYYDYDRMLDHILRMDPSSTYEDAADMISYNTIGALGRPGDPRIVYKYDGLSFDDIIVELDVAPESIVDSCRDAFIGVVDSDAGLECVYDISKCTSIGTGDAPKHSRAHFIHVA